MTLGASVAEEVTLADGRAIDSETFYRERDHRSQVNGEMRCPTIRVAVGLSRDMLDTAAGQAALIWAASIVRRMGRAFAGVRLVTPALATEVPYRACLHAQQSPRTLGEAVELELLGADPFASIEWQDTEDARALQDIDHIVWVGCPPVGMAFPAPTIIVRARGWVVSVEERAAMRHLVDGEASPQSTEMLAHGDAAPAALIAGVALAAGAVYRMARRASPNSLNGTQENAPQRSPGDSAGRLEPVVNPYWYSTDTGAVTTDASEGASWIGRGSSAPTCAPWTGTAVPHGAHLVLVSAGGLGGNVAHALAESAIHFKAAAVVDPDRIDLTNLNRLIGVFLGDVGASKVAVATRALALVTERTPSAETTYEEWARVNREFLDAPSCVLVVGVDQVLTRLEAQADWPSLILNGSTGGTGWHVSAHRRGAGGCVGCLFATDQRSYAITRGPQACAVAGDNAVGVQAIPNQTVSSIPAPPVAASFPFVSVSAAAVIVARLIRELWKPFNQTPPSPTALTPVHRMNALVPTNAFTSDLPRHPQCSLLCSHDALEVFFGRISDQSADGMSLVASPTTTVEECT